METKKNTKESRRDHFTWKEGDLEFLGNVNDHPHLKEEKDDDSKKDKSVVNYSMGKPHAHCGLCEHFIKSENECELVKGRIDPDHWCKLFEKK